MTATKKSATKARSTSSSAPGFTDEERAAMKERAEELKASGRSGKKKADDLNKLLEKIAEMSQPDRGMAERIHAIVTSVAPELAPKTWYGQPAYADKDGKIVCFFQARDKFGSRYATLGFNDAAHLDEGTMWPTSYALMDLTDDDATLIESLVTRAVS